MHAAVKNMYELVMTRRGAYIGLIQVLRKTKQTGPLDILSRIDWNLPGALSVVTHFLDRLRSVRLKFLDQIIRFDNVFPDFYLADASELFNNPEAHEEFLKICEEDQPILELQAPLPDPHPLYMERSLSSRILVDPEIFRTQTSDVFVFKCISHTELTDMTKPHPTRSSSSQLGYISGRHIQLERDEHWDDLVEVARSPIHLVCKTEEGFVVQRSTQVTALIQENVLYPTGNDSAYVSEDKFVDGLLSNPDIKGVSLCDIPGMGKTWLLESLARKIQQKATNMLVFYFQMAAFSEYLNNYNCIEDSSPLQVILEFSCRSKLAAQLLNRFAKESVSKLVFIFDGFDEVRPHLHSQTKSFLKTFCYTVTSKTAMIIVSSRSYLKKELEQICGDLSYDILPLCKEEQINVLVSHWRHKFPHVNSENFIPFAESCIQSAKHLAISSSEDMLGVPLKCYILAVINEKQARRCSIESVGSTGGSSVGRVSTIASICDLYERFVERAFQNVEETAFFGDTETKGSLTQNALAAHILEALKLICPKISTFYQQNIKSVKFSIDEIQRFGILCSRGSHLTFVHRSFAEYFVGRFFADFWLTCDKQPNEMIEPVTLCFITDILQSRPKTALLINRIELSQINADWKSVFMYSSEFSNSTVLWFMNCIISKNPNYRDIVNKISKVKDALIPRTFCPGWTDYFLSRYYPGFKDKDRKEPVYFIHNMYSYFLCDIPGVKYLRDLLVSRGYSIPSIEPDAVPRFSNADTYFEACLQKNLFPIVMACIDEGLQAILTLLRQLVKVFIDRRLNLSLLTAPLPYVRYLPSDFDQPSIRKWSEDNREVSSLAVILNRVAKKGAPEMAYELFEFFGDYAENPLVEFCLNYPESWKSPIDIAIDANDADMFMFFMDKFCYDTDVALARCFETSFFITETQMMRRSKICRSIAIRNETRVCPKFISNYIIQQARTNQNDTMDIFLGIFLSRPNISIEFLKHLLAGLDVSFTDLTLECKATLLTRALSYSNDMQFVDALLVLFPKQDEDWYQEQEVYAELDAAESNDVHELGSFSAGYVLQALSHEDLLMSFSKVKHENQSKFFSRLESTESLKLLTLIIPEFNQHNSNNCSYLHYAVGNGNLEWVKYLIDRGYDVDSRDNDGDTPLLCITMKNALSITKVLRSAEANMCSINKNNENVAHVIIKHQRKDFIQDLQDWSLYMIHNGYEKLWSMIDWNEATPLDSLTLWLGEDHPTVKAISSELIRLAQGIDHNSDLTDTLLTRDVSHDSSTSSIE